MKGVVQPVDLRWLFFDLHLAIVDLPDIVVLESEGE